ncbi:hypothetical protein Ddc_15258 [Ditylenchus destructor]|nr:hypothetical protein Ddc_15258 [Ditylenchus destructor]
MLLFVKSVLFLAFVSWDIAFSVDTFPEYCKDKDKFNEQINQCAEKEKNATEKDLNQLCEEKLAVVTCIERMIMPCDNGTKEAFMPFIEIPPSAQNIEKCQEARSILEKMNGGIIIESSSTVPPPVTVPAATSDPGKLNTTELNGPQTSDGTQETTVSGSKGKYNLTAFAVFTVLLVLKILAIESSQNL